MLRTIVEPDWKVLRRLHPLALERFCERVLAEVEQIMQNRQQSAHRRNDPRRSRALTMLAGIRSEGLLTDDEFSALSADTRGAIEMLLGEW